MQSGQCSHTSDGTAHNRSIASDCSSTSALCPQHPIKFRRSLNHQRHDVGNSLFSSPQRVAIPSQTREGLFFPFQEEPASLVQPKECDDLAPLGVKCDVACVLASRLRCVSTKGEKRNHLRPKVWKNAAYLRRYSYKNSSLHCKNTALTELKCDESTVAWLLEVKVFCPLQGEAMAVILMESCRWPWTPTADLSLAPDQLSDYIILSGDYHWTVSQSRIQSSITNSCSAVLFCLGSSVFSSLI